MKLVTKICWFILIAGTLALPLDDSQDQEVKRRINPEEIANEFEGDIVLSEEPLTRTGRNGLTDLSKRWPKNSYGQVIVPFTIRADYSASDLNLIKAAIEEIQKTTCVRFTARTNEANYIEILSKSGCSSSVGRVGGRQEVSLGNSAGATHCMVKGIIIHELLHALGFYHMHSSMDRDNYVKVNYENVIWGLSYAFSKYTSSNYGTAYDLESVLHYDPYYFTNNGKPTIEPINKAYMTNKLMGQRLGLSTGDIKRVNNMYQC